MKTPKRVAAPADKAALYEQLVATNPDIELKGATHPYTSLNGNMFTYPHPSGSMALRLPADERDEFLKKYKTTLFEAYGVIHSLNGIVRRLGVSEASRSKPSA
jgi:hypothetical protein